MVLEKTLESSLGCKEIKSVNPKGNRLWIFIGRIDAVAELQNFSHLMQRTDSLEEIPMLEKIEGGRRRVRQRMRRLDGITNSWSSLKLMSIESMIPSNHLILCRPLFLPPSIFPSIRVFPMSQFFTSGGQSIGVSASASVLSVNIQDWFPLGWTGWISLLSKGLSTGFSNTTVQKHQFFGAQLSL